MNRGDTKAIPSGPRGMLARQACHADIRTCRCHPNAKSQWYAAATAGRETIFMLPAPGNPGGTITDRVTSPQHRVARDLLPYPDSAAGLLCSADWQDSELQRAHCPVKGERLRRCVGQSSILRPDTGVSALPEKAGDMPVHVAGDSQSDKCGRPGLLAAPPISSVFRIVILKCKTTVASIGTPGTGPKLNNEVIRIERRNDCDFPQAG